MQLHKAFQTTRIVCVLHSIRIPHPIFSLVEEDLADGNVRDCEMYVATSLTLGASCLVS